MNETTDPRSDFVLVREARTGNESAFCELIHRYRPRICRIASRFVLNSHDLEDLVQEVCIRIWRTLNQFRAEAPFEHWLSKISIRVCYDHLRKSQNRHLSIPLEENASTLRDPGSDPSGFAFENLYKAMQTLSPEDRLVLTLLELEERSVREISDWTGWSESNVKVRAHRARQTLKQRLQNQSNE